MIHDFKASLRETRPSAYRPFHSRSEAPDGEWSGHAVNREGPQGLASAGCGYNLQVVGCCVCCNASFYSLRISLLSLPRRCCCLCLHLPPSPPVLPSLSVSQLESSIPQHPSPSLLFCLPLFIAPSGMIMFLGSTLARKFYHTTHSARTDAENHVEGMACALWTSKRIGIFGCCVLQLNFEALWAFCHLNLQCQCMSSLDGISHSDSDSG